ALLLMFHAGDYRRKQDKPGSALREVEVDHAQRFVSQLLRFPAVCGQDPHLHALFGLFVGFDFVRLAVRQESKCAVMPKAGRSVLAVAACKLRWRTAVSRDLPDVARVLRTITVEALHYHSEPGPAR